MDFSSIVVPKIHMENPKDFSDPVYEEFIRNAKKSVEEAKALGWKSTSVIAPDETMARKLESLLREIKDLNYERHKCSFEIRWSDIKEPEPRVQDIPIDLTNLEAMLIAMVEEMNFGE